MSNEYFDYVRDLLWEEPSKFTGVVFRKADGSIRRMVIKQSSIKKNVKGDAACETAKKALATRKANNPNLIAVYDVADKSIKSLDMNRLISVSRNKTTKFIGG